MSYFNVRRGLRILPPPAVRQVGIHVSTKKSNICLTRNHNIHDLFLQSRQDRYLHHKIGHFQSSFIQIHPEVAEALASPIPSQRKPVIALESTILAHGLPYPQNLQLARDLSSIVRSKGVVPATIAIKNGICRVGLTKEEIADLAVAGTEGRAQKCSTRDLPLLLAKASNYNDHDANHANYDFMYRSNQYNSIHKTIWGATTVASTMRLAHLAGINTFFTGGTGGVHRGGESTMDVSADLQELAQTPVCVISAGIKSILDIRRTLEMLETLSVPVATFQSDEFPAFFSARSGVRSPARVESAKEVALAFHASRTLGLSSGMLVAVPNNDPAGENTEAAIQDALSSAIRLGIEGKYVTPFILQSVAEKTGGDSLRSNIALVKRNATIGADIANAIFENMEQSTDHINVFSRSSKLDFSSTLNQALYSPVVVMGGSVVDIIAMPDGTELVHGSSTPGVCLESDGGVARNIAEVLGRLGARPILFSAVGADTRGQALLKHLIEQCGVISLPGRSIKIVDEASTASYIALMNKNNDLHAAIADMRVLEYIPVPDREYLSKAKILCIDSNPTLERIIQAVQSATSLGVKVFFEPTSVPKARNVCTKTQLLSHLTYASPNVDELFAMADIDGGYVMSRDFDFLKLREVAQLVIGKMMPDAALIITLGENGVLLASKSAGNITFRHFPAIPCVNIVNTTGAGDTLAGSFVKAILDGKDDVSAVHFGQEMAVKSIQYAKAAISPYIVGSTDEP